EGCERSEQARRDEREARVRRAERRQARARRTPTPPRRSRGGGTPKNSSSGLRWIVVGLVAFGLACGSPPPAASVGDESHPRAFPPEPTRGRLLDLRGAVLAAGG